MKRLLALAAAVVALAAGCGGDDDRPAEVVLVTHDSFAVSKPVRRAFERETGLKLRVLQSGDAGAMLNRALPTAGDPEGDVLFGVDSSLLSRALDEDLFEPCESPELAHVAPAYLLDDQHRVTPRRAHTSGSWASRATRRRSRSSWAETRS